MTNPSVSFFSGMGFTATDLSPDAHQVAIETMEIAHQGLTIENG